MPKSNEIIKAVIYILISASVMINLLDLDFIYKGVQHSKMFGFFFLVILLVTLKCITVLFRTEPFHLSVGFVDLFVFFWWFYSTVRLFPEMMNGGFKNSDYLILTSLTIWYYIVKTYIGNFRLRNIILMALLVCCLLQSLYGMFQLYGILPSNHRLFKITGGFYNPGPYSGFLISIFPFALHISLSLIKSYGCKKSYFEIALKYLSTAAAIFVILIIPAAMSRTSWLALIVCTLIVIQYHYGIHRYLKQLLNTRTKKKLAFVFLTFLTLTSFYAVFNLKPASANGRFLIWKITNHVIEDHFLFGAGYGSFHKIFGEYQAKYFTKNYSEAEAMLAGNGQYAFNEYLKIGAELGVFGFVLFLGILIFTIFRLDPALLSQGFVHKKYSWLSNRRTFYRFVFHTDKKSRIKRPQISETSLDMKAGAYPSLIAILIFAFFSYPFSIVPIMINLYMWILILSYDKPPVKTIKIPTSYAKTIALVALIVTGLTTNYLIASVQSYKTWKKARFHMLQENFNEAADLYQDIYPYVNYNKEYLLQFGQSLAMASQHDKAIKILEEAKKNLCTPFLYTSLGYSYQVLKRYDKAEESFLYASKLNPSLFYPIFLLAKLNYEKGDQKTAAKYAGVVLNKKVKTESKAIDEMRTEALLMLQSLNISTHEN